MSKRELNRIDVLTRLDTAMAGAPAIADRRRGRPSNNNRCLMSCVIPSPQPTSKTFLPLNIGASDWMTRRRRSLLNDLSRTPHGSGVWYSASKSMVFICRYHHNKR